MGRPLWIALALTCAAACGDSSDGDPDAAPLVFPPDHDMLTGDFLNIAHRGGALLVPEETLESLTQ